MKSICSMFSRRPSAATATILLRVVPVVALAVSVPMLAGCDGGIKRYPVAGVVLVDGQPLEHGIVRVYPEGARSAYGKIGKDGKFVLGTYDDNDGTLAGTHVVAVDAREWVGPRKLKWHAPKKYASPKSGLAVSIEGATDDVSLNLTWDGGEAFVENLGGGGGGT